MSGTTITTAEINTKMNEAITYQEAGEYSSALAKVRSVKMMLAAKPDTEFDREKLIWNREAIDEIYAELKRLSGTESGSLRGSIVQIPVRRASSLYGETDE